MFPGYHGGTIDYKTRRVFLSFLIIVFLTFFSCVRKVTSDIFEGDIVTNALAIIFFIIIIIIKSIILVYCFSLVVLVPGKSQVITVKGDIVMVAGGNILDET